MILADGSIYEEKGNVEFLGRAIDANTGSILVQASFDNKKGLLRPGMYAKVRVEFEVARRCYSCAGKMCHGITGTIFGICC